MNTTLSDLLKRFLLCRIRSVLAVGAASLIAAPGAYAQATPDSVPGLQLWLDASRGVSVDESGKVSGWRNEAGPTGAEQADPEKQPSLQAAAGGRPAALRFDGAADALTAPDAGKLVSDSLTLFVVFSQDGEGGEAALVDCKAVNSTNRGFYLSTRPNGRLTFGFSDHGSGLLSLQTLPLPPESAGKELIAMARLDSTGLGTLRVMDRAETKDHAMTITNLRGSSPFTLGSASTHLWFLNGTLRTVLLYNRALADEEAQTVFAFLRKSLPNP